MKKIWITAAVMAASLLSACGVSYNVATVRTQTEGTDVRVVLVTPETVIMANRAPYAPRSLPSVFYNTAAGPGAMRSVGALPAMPFVPEIERESITLTPPPSVAREPYRIGVGDVLLLATKRATSTVEELTGLLAAQNQRQGYTVRDDGSIAIPDIGAVRIAGLTLEEAEARLFQQLVANQIDPSFSLEVAEFNSRRVSVGGAVNATRIVPIGLTPLVLRDAINAAGGLTLRDEQFAVIRIYRDGSLYQIPMRDYLMRPELQTTQLVNGDAIYVDTTYDLDRALQFYAAQLDVISRRQQARSSALQELQAEVNVQREIMAEQRQNFRSRLEFGAEPRDHVYLAGEVGRQGRVTMPYRQNATLADVLFGSGGVQPITGDPRNIYVLRASTDPDEFGAVTAWHLDATNAANLTLATRLQMRPNDVVFVEEQPITKWNRALQQFFPTVISTAAAAVASPTN